ncbi:MAG: peptidase T [Candidatus Eisenbacteria bacterium]|jgi:tripeptide aminopeptidase|nr:peptidase T [Candidatus Eisenbacteria bacterium]
MSETTLKTSAVERFLRYVTFDTQSDENSTTYPSTAGQLVLLDTLVEELREIGLQDAARDEHGYVFATVPATSAKVGVPVIGFIAHVDTSPETSGANVKPVIHRNWQGGDIVLPDDPSAVLCARDIPALREQVGNDIITASGTTLLGADNKAGVAEIVAAAEYLMQHPEIPHGVIRVGFTPDEEVGRGTKHFDVQRFGASAAYTLDGESRGHLECETFSADAMTVTFQGFNTHPGFAKGVMINAIKVAADFVNRLPKDRLSPETTQGREGFVHPYVVEASVDKTSVRVLIRDFATPGLKEKEEFIERLAHETVAAWPGASVTTKIEESYRNMKEVLDEYPQVVENAREAIRRAGLTVRETAIRGGTDGSRLSFMGLPTPNVFAGEHGVHSRFEWISAQDMEKAVEVIIDIARVWEERT